MSYSNDYVFDIFVHLLKKTIHLVNLNVFWKKRVNWTGYERGKKLGYPSAYLKIVWVKLAGLYRMGIPWGTLAFKVSNKESSAPRLNAEVQVRKESHEVIDARNKRFQLPQSWPNPIECLMKLV